MTALKHDSRRAPTLSTSTRTHTSVMIVEDDADTRAGLEVQLLAAGYAVTSVADDRQALALVQVRNPDLLLLDLGLPGEGGLALLRKLQLVMRRAPKVVVLSAWDRCRFEPQALANGAAAYLQKPVESVELLATLDHLLQEGAS